MSAAIKSEFPDASVDLIGGGRGDFIVTVESSDDGAEVWNKKKSGDFPENEQVLERLRLHAS